MRYGNSDVTARELVENVEHRDVEGGTAPRAVRAQLEAAKATLVITNPG
jgi:hypothetical protein